MKITSYLFVLEFIAVMCAAKLREDYKEEIHNEKYHNIGKKCQELLTSYQGKETEKDSNYWIDEAQKTLKKKTHQKLNTNQAKNVIMFLGDGCSFSTWFASRIYIAQSLNLTGGEDYKLAVEDFPYTGLSKTYCVDSQVADSACSATAFLNGVKGNIGTIGVNAHVKYEDCEASTNPETHTKSLARWFQEAGKKTGVISNMRITHATPAGVYANVASRNWENDAYMLKYDQDPTKCPDIARQLIEGVTGKNLNVILGGGWRNFIPHTQTDSAGKKGQRADGRNLIEEWKNDKGSSGTYISNREELLSTTKTDYLLGLFSTSHMNFHIDHKETQPTLREMVQAGIKQLSNGNSDGYFLFVEGGLIDIAHHGTKAVKALSETAAFNEAILAAVEMTSTDDTLIVVTSDHSHAMITSGYAKRGNDIFGIAGDGDDNIAFTTLSYSGGPHGFKQEHGKRYDVSNDNRGGKNYKFPALVPLESSNHAGEDVGIFALGPYGHLFTGVVEQNVIPHLIAYAACVGNGMKSCGEENCNDRENHSSMHESMHYKDKNNYGYNYQHDSVKLGKPETHKTHKNRYSIPNHC